MVEALSREADRAEMRERFAKDAAISDIETMESVLPDRFMSSPKSRTIPPLRVSEERRADAESVFASGETLSDHTVTETAIRHQREEDYH
jgi:hypothetical protein